MCLNVPFIILGPEVNDFVPSGFLILFPREHRTFYILCFFKYNSIGNCFEVISSQINEDVRNNNPWNAEKIWFRNYLQEICHKNNHVRQNTSVPHETCHYYWLLLCWKLGTQQPVVWIRIFRISRINHNVAVWVGRLLLYGDFISRPLADALRIDDKKGKK